MQEVQRTVVVVSMSHAQSQKLEKIKKQEKSSKLHGPVLWNAYKFEEIVLEIYFCYLDAMAHNKIRHSSDTLSKKYKVLSIQIKTFNYQNIPSTFLLTWKALSLSLCANIKRKMHKMAQAQII